MVEFYIIMAVISGVLLLVAAFVFGLTNIVNAVLPVDLGGFLKEVGKGFFMLGLFILFGFETQSTLSGILTMFFGYVIYVAAERI